MPSDRFFLPGARVSAYPYQLGLDRTAEEETRNPRVLWGDPGLATKVEEWAANRWASPSTNFALNFSEKLDDCEALARGREYVEDTLLVGVPETKYIYTLIAHDEAASSEVTGLGKRTSLHGKIVNFIIPEGKALQPMYSPRDRFLTTILFSVWAIQNNWSHPLDEDRVRCFKSHHKYGDVAELKRAIDARIKKANRLPDGKPDPVAIMEELVACGFSDVDRNLGLLGKRGVALQVDGHESPIRLFGPEYETLHSYIEKTENIQNHEYEKRTGHVSRREFFAGGHLERTDESLSRLSSALTTWRASRARHNRQRYNLDCKTMDMGSPLHLGDIVVGRSDGVAHLAVPDPESTTRESGTRETPIDFRPDEVTNELASPGSEKSQQTAQASGELRNSNLRGAVAHLGVLSAGALEVATKLLRSIGTRIADRELGARKCGENYQSLDVASKQLATVCSEFDAASRDLESALARGVITAGLVRDWAAEQAEPGTESIRRVKRLLREPRLPTASAPTMGGQP